MRISYWSSDVCSSDLVETQVLRLLRRGLVWGIARQTLLSLETPKILLAICSAGVCAAIGAAVRAVILLLGLFKIDGSASPTFARMMSAPVPRFASRSTAFERHLRKAIFGDKIGRASCRERVCQYV